MLASHADNGHLLVFVTMSLHCELDVWGNGRAKAHQVLAHTSLVISNCPLPVGLEPCFQRIDRNGSIVSLRKYRVFVPTTQKSQLH
jgi:hypothetical protein